MEKGTAFHPKSASSPGRRVSSVASGLIGVAVFSTMLFSSLAGRNGQALPAEELAAKFNRVLKIGDRAPNWGELPGVDGKNHSLAEFKESKAVVVVFTCNRCPVSKQYAERLEKFVKHYDKQVTIVAISVSHHPVDRFQAMQERQAKKPYPYQYLYDESQKSGRAYGASATPQFFVLNKDRKVAYMGAFDDNFANPDRVEKHYLVDAVEAVLAGKEPPTRESLPHGCEIEYK